MFTQSQANQTQQEIQAEQTPVNAEVNAEESAVDVEATESEVSFINVGDNVADMFTDAEWNQMISEFRKQFPSDTQGVHTNQIKALLMDTTDSQNVDILNDLAKRIGKGEKMKTINEKGEEIDVC